MKDRGPDSWVVWAPLSRKENMTTDIREFIKTIREIVQEDNAMRVRERQNQNAETITMPRIRACGTTETMIMPAIPNENEILPGDNTTSYPNKAIAIVYRYVRSAYVVGSVPDFNVHVVWFCKILQHWKALVGTTMQDGKYFEITYNGDKNEYYLDDYGKNRNIRIDAETMEVE